MVNKHDMFVVRPSNVHLLRNTDTYTALLTSNLTIDAIRKEINEHDRFNIYGISLLQGDVYFAAPSAELRNMNAADAAIVRSKLMPTTDVYGYSNITYHQDGNRQYAKTHELYTTSDIMDNLLDNVLYPATTILFCRLKKLQILTIRRIINERRKQEVTN